jgi:hypothetical protein
MVSGLGLSLIVGGQKKSASDSVTYHVTARVTIRRCVVNGVAVRD